MVTGQQIQDCKPLLEAYGKLWPWQFKEKKKLREQIDAAIASNNEIINNYVC